VVDAVLHYINEHYSEPLTLDQLSEKFFISKYHLLRKFDAQVGTTVHRYILQKRLLNAKQETSRLLKEDTEERQVRQMLIRRQRSDPQKPKHFQR